MLPLGLRYVAILSELVVIQKKKIKEGKTAERSQCLCVSTNNQLVLAKLVPSFLYLSTRES